MTPECTFAKDPKGIIIVRYHQQRRRVVVLLLLLSTFQMVCDPVTWILLD